MDHATQQAAGSPDPERARLAGPDAAAWRRWGPYLSERAWGTVREDYSPHGTAWEALPHDHARSRAYRWNEDGLAGLCDDQQRLCVAFAFHNGRDPLLKERLFGLTGNEGNHGEDAKELWWYRDATPTHSWSRWQYAYPQAPFPYHDLVTTNASRGRDEAEYELLDTGVFDHGHWDITVDHAKAAPDDVCIRVTVVNAGPETSTLEVLPTIWFRNTWSWDVAEGPVPALHADDGRIVATHPELPVLTLAADGEPTPLFCDNVSNARRLWGVDGPAHPKDAINDHVVHGAPTVNPERTGTKAALRSRVTVPAGGQVELRLRLSTERAPDLGADWERTLQRREQEADAFYAALAPAAPAEERAVLRQAAAGMLWGKQFYHLDVERWLEGDPAQPSPPPERRHGRNAHWHHLNTYDVISMPDPWEYPWFAAWDLAFHTVALAHLDPEFAKAQLILLCREWYQHPNGQLPAYEWAFGDVNPPVHAWAALRVFEIDGAQDTTFLARILHKLLLNFSWWVNRKDSHGSNVFEGGFLGLDNIGPIDRSATLPEGVRLEQSDGTAWMAMYCLNLLEMSLVLAERDPAYEDLAVKFNEHFAYIATAIHDQGLWDEHAGFYHDQLRCDDGSTAAVEVRSMVGLIPLYAVTTLGTATFGRLPDFAGHFAWFLEHKPQYREAVGHVRTLDGYEGRMLSIASPERLRRILTTMLDEDAFFSPFGLRSLSREHHDRPFTLELAGSQASVGYEPGESTTGLFGGNSNWRGPVWFPVNQLVIESLRRYHRFLGDEWTVELPTGSGHQAPLGEVADELSRRLTALFLDDERGRRPAFGDATRLQEDPVWHDRLLFHEYFHGDTGAGLGASHQTGWTGLVIDLIIQRHGRRTTVNDATPPQHGDADPHGPSGDADRPDGAVVTA